MADEFENEAFYEAVAQAIPIVILAALIEYEKGPLNYSRLFEKILSSKLFGRTISNKERTAKRVSAVFVIALTLGLGLAEFAALDILWRHEAAPFPDALVWIGLYIAAGAIFLPLLIVPFADFCDNTSNKALQWLLGLILALIVVGSALALGVF